MRRNNNDKGYEHYRVKPTLTLIGSGKESFTEWRGGYCKFVPISGGYGTKKCPLGNIFDLPRGEMSCIRGKLSDRVGNNVILSPEGAVLMAFPGTESSNPPHSLNDSKRKKKMAKSVFQPITYSYVNGFR